MNKSLNRNFNDDISQQGFPHNVSGYYGSRSEPSHRRPVAPQDPYWTRFLEIYREICGTSAPPVPSLVLQNHQPTVPSDEEVALADELYLQELSKVARSKSIFRNSKKSDGKEYTTATAALRRLVEDGGSAGVAQSLVKKGGLIALSKDPPKQTKQISERHDIITRAASLGRTQLVGYLATISPPERIGEALATSVKAGNVDVTRQLLEHGASPDSLFQLDHFNSLSTAMLELLLRSPTPPSTSSRTRWLASALAEAKLDLVITLLRYGTIHDADYLAILRKAIDELHLPAFLIALKSMHASGTMWFNGLLQKIAKCTDLNITNKTLAMEATLCVAKTKEARAYRQRLRVSLLLDRDQSETLEIVVSSGQLGFVQLLRQSRFNTAVSATTLNSAIRACDLHLLDDLYAENSPRILPSGFLLADLPLVEDETLRNRLLSRLLRLKIKGSYLDKQLLLAIPASDLALARSLIDAGASVDEKVLMLAIMGQQVRMVRELITHATESVRNVVFGKLLILEKLPRRLITQLFVERGLNKSTLDTALLKVVCEWVPWRDEALIDILVKAGGDFRMIEPSAVYEILDNGDVQSLRDLLDRMSKYDSATSHYKISTFVSDLLSHLIVPPTTLNNYVRYQLIKLLITHGAFGDCILRAFNDFIKDGLNGDEDLMRLFLSPMTANRSNAYNNIIAHVLQSMDMWVLLRLIDKIDLTEEVVELVLKNATNSSIKGDSNAAERLRCVLTRAQSKTEVLEKGLDSMIRNYAEHFSSNREWPTKTIDVLISKGFAGTIWLRHSLMAVTEVENIDLLAKILDSAKEECSQDMIDSAVMLTVQHEPVCNLQILGSLLDFGASQKGLDMALLMSAERDAVQAATVLLRQGANVNFRSGECLVTAIQHDQRAVLGFLLGQENLKQPSLSTAWDFIVSSTSDLSSASRARHCAAVLQAGFDDGIVLSYLFQDCAHPFPDYDMIMAIFDNSVAFKQDMDPEGAEEHISVVTKSRDDASETLLATLDCAIKKTDERLCGLVLNYFTTSSRIPLDFLRRATSTNLAISALLLGHLAPADRQEVLDTCLAHAVSSAKDVETCKWLLAEGATCEALDYGALSAATLRALDHGVSDRAFLEALLASNPTSEALGAAWVIAVASLEGEDDSTDQASHHLQTLAVLELILCAGYDNVEAFQACIHALCTQARTCTDQCDVCAREDAFDVFITTEVDCCPSRRIQVKKENLCTVMLDRGLQADFNNGESVIAATRNHHYEMLEILFASTPKSFEATESLHRHDETQIFFDHSSSTPAQLQARLKTLRALLRRGTGHFILQDALRVAVEHSLTNVEARYAAQLLLEHHVQDTRGDVIRHLSANPKPAVSHLLALALEMEVPREVRLEAVENLVASDLDEETMSGLIVSAMRGTSASELLEMSPEEAQNILCKISATGKVGPLAMLLSCMCDKSILSPFQSTPSFLTWLLRSYALVTEDFLAVVLEYLGPEEVKKVDDLENSLVQEAVLGRKTGCIPTLLSFGAARATKEGSSLLYYTIENTKGQSTPEDLKAILSLCDESTVDDGSLQLAVVSMREDVVNVLLEQGHDPNNGKPMGSSSEEEELPLNILCSTASVASSESDCGFLFKRLMISLMMRGANIQAKVSGRSCLFNALDNPRCTVGLLTNVMECFQLSEHLDDLRPQTSSGWRFVAPCRESSIVEDADETGSFRTAATTPSISEDAKRASFFEFEDETHHYSASMYLMKNVKSPPHHRETNFSAQKKTALLEYLRRQDLPDIYYALEGPQPDDAIGVPIELLLGTTGCEVCGDMVERVEDAYSNLAEVCAHERTQFMCPECLAGYMESKISVENGAVNANVPCWVTGCSNTLSHAEIKKFSDADLFEKYDRALLEQIIHEGETFAECCTRGCKGGGWLESQDVSYFRCTVCHVETCVSHGGPRSDHAGKPCPATPEGQRYAEEEAREEAERQAAQVAKNKAEQEARQKAKAEADRLAKERKEGLKATEALMKKMTKNCPGCKVPIEKKDGCDHMTCRSGSGRAGCGLEWCWLCSALYSEIRRIGNSAHAATCAHYRRNTYGH